MKNRPTSVTVIAWIILILSGLSLLGAVVVSNDAKALEAMAANPIPVPLQRAHTFAGLAIEVLCAVFMLRAANWARLLYIGWVGLSLLVLFATSPEKAILIPAVVVYAVSAFILLRPAATAYFTQSTGGPIDS